MTSPNKKTETPCTGIAVATSEPILHEQIDSYLNGLLTYEEIISVIPRIKPHDPELRAHPGLADGFTTIGIAALLVRAALIRAEVGSTQAPPTWTISEDGGRMSGNLMLTGDQVGAAMVPAGGADFGWIHPSISFDLPEHTIIGEILPETLRQLAVLDGILMPRSEADTIREMREEGRFLI